MERDPNSQPTPFTNVCSLLLLLSDDYVAIPLASLRSVLKHCDGNVCGYIYTTYKTGIFDMSRFCTVTDEDIRVMSENPVSQSPYQCLNWCTPDTDTPPGEMSKIQPGLRAVLSMAVLGNEPQLCIFRPPLGLSS